MSGDPFQILPPELVSIVLALLPSVALYRVGQVSSRWRLLSDNAMLPRARLGLQRVLRSTTLPTENIHTWSFKMIDDRLSQMPRVSATDYFDNICSFRVLFLATDLLAQRWASGRPTGVQNINRNFGRRYRKAHYAEILSVIIDIQTRTLITGDVSGNLMWWDVASGKNLYGHHTNMEQHEPPLLAASAGCLALSGDRLAVGTWPSRGENPFEPALVFLMHRAPHQCCYESPEKGGGESRFVSSELRAWVRSSAMTIQLEASVCIVASQGLVQFWDIQGRHPSQLLTINTANFDIYLWQSHVPWYNLAIYYRKPSLYVADSCISVFRPKHADSDNARQIWDYPSDDIERQLIYSDCRPEEEITVDDHGFCRLVPQSGSAVVQAVSSDRRLLMIPENSVVASATSEIHGSSRALASKTVRCIATTAGYIGIGTEAKTNPDHRQPRTEAEVHLLHEDGEAIVTFEDHFGDVNCLAMDPCFFVSVSDDLSVMMRDYRPQHVLNC